VTDTPSCENDACRMPLARIDHYGIEHTILSYDDDGNEIYRPVGLMDGSAAGDQFGLASDIDLRCGYCGTSIPREAREYFYKRWTAVKEYMAANGLRSND
jgi:hypothetical protein